MSNSSASNAIEAHELASITTSLDLSSLVALADIASHLSDSSFEGLAGQPVNTLLDVYEIVTSIAIRASTLAQIVENLSAKPMFTAKYGALSSLRGDLLAIVERSSGEAREDCSLAELSRQTVACIKNFQELIGELETTERDHQASIEFLESLDQVKLLVFSRSSLVPFRDGWQECEEVARGQLRSGDIEAARTAILPFSQRWLSIADQCKAMASHYHLMAPANLLSEIHTPRELAAQICSIADWMDASVLATLSQLSPSDLPDLPDANWTSLYPISELVMFTELQLATNRALAIAREGLLQHLARLAASCSCHPSSWMTERESQTLASLLEQHLAETNRWNIIATARSLFGDRIEGIIAPIILRTASNLLWRLPGTSETPDPDVLREKHIISHSFLRAPDKVSLVTRLHVETYGQSFLPTTELRTDLFAELAELNSFGAWCFAAYLNAVESTIDEPLLQRYFTDSVTGALQWERALPLVYIRKIDFNDSGLVMLFAALELLFPPTVELPYTAAWMAVNSDHIESIPQLSMVLESHALRGSGREVALTSGRDEGDLALAESEARECIRPFRYRNRRSLAKAAIAFQRETAEPLFAEARTIHDAADCRPLLERLEQSLYSLENTLDEGLDHDLHIDPVGRVKLIEHCQRILDAIERRKNLRKSAQSPPTGWRLLPSRLVAARQRRRSRRTVLAIKGSLTPRLLARP